MTTNLLTKSVSLAPGPAVIEHFELDASYDPTATLLLISAVDGDGSIASAHEVLHARPAELALPSASVVAEAANDTITLTTNATALYVVLTTLAPGRFEDNAFALTPAGRTISFVPFGAFDADLLASSLRVEHLAERVGLF